MWSRDLRRNCVRRADQGRPDRRPSGGLIPASELDTPITYEHLQKLGSYMGSGGMIVMDETDDLVELSRFYLGFCVDESCGKCAPCRIGGTQMLRLLDRIAEGGAPRKISRRSDGWPGHAESFPLRPRPGRSQSSSVGPALLRTRIPRPAGLAQQLSVPPVTEMILATITASG